MSKSSKTKAKLKRRLVKAARKSEQQKRYAHYMKLGQNTKSKRSRVNAKGKAGLLGDHPLGQCGNVGCIKCYGVHYRPFLKKGQPNHMPHWMWRRWNNLTDQEQKIAA